MPVLEKLATTGNSVTLTNWQGTVTQTGVTANSVTTHTINTTIPANKIVVASLENLSGIIEFPDGTEIALLDPYGSPTTRTGAWYKFSKMAYFKTTNSGTFTVQVTSKTAVNYRLRVAVVNRIPSFTQTNVAGQTSTTSTHAYMMSNTPELLSINQQKGEWGSYLARGKANGYFRLYYEHMNQFAGPMLFGVLLWNKGSTAVNVSLVDRNIKTAPDGNPTTAVTTVWVDCFGSVKATDSSELSPGSVLTLPAYSASNPGNSAKWVAMHSVPLATGTDPNKGLFNGVLTLQLTNPGTNTPYTQENVFCDTYIITPNYQSQIKGAIANMVPAAPPTGATESTYLMRGSGCASQLVASLTSVSVSPGNNYNILLTGLDVENLQTGEIVKLTNYSNSGNNTKDGLNYGMVYRLDLNVTSSSVVNMKIRCSVYTNPAKAGSTLDRAFAGVYYATFLSSGGPIYKGLVMNTTNEIAETKVISNIPRNQALSMYIVVSGMSSLPMEISFTTDN